jgi:hypothetical protein
MTPRSRGADRARALLKFLSLKTEGAGNAGCLLHPRSRVQDGDGGAHEHTGTAGALRHSLRNGLTAYAALSPETNSSCLRHCRLDGWSIRLDRIRHRQLDTSNGCQDHTVLPYAASLSKIFDQQRAADKRFRRRRLSVVRLRAMLTHGKPPCEHPSRLTLPRPPQPAPTFVTMANAPLLGTGWREF